jgi:membrane-associated protein
MTQLLDLIRHLPEHLEAWATAYGMGLYFILAAIIFAETGLVVTPILPGDSLLFAAGALMAMNLPGLSLPVMAVVLICSAVAGDVVNYHVGRWAARRWIEKQRIRWINPRHLQKTNEFYARHGGKTLILARFIPIVRTYAPFVAGLGGLRLSRFVLFSVCGGSLWISLFLCLGYFFGNIPAVKHNFELAVLAIVVISLAPVVMQLVRTPKPSEVS